MTLPRTAMALRQCPLTCGLPTRITEGGFARACAVRMARLEKLAAVNSTDPHAAFCRECKGAKRPEELEIISMEEMIMGQHPTGEKPYAMPPALAAVLRPMSQWEAEAATIIGLVKFWRRPLIKHNAKSACPCCGGVHQLRSSGICSGCYSANVIKNNLTGLALLEHLALRAGGVSQRTGRKKTKESISPASAPSSPSAPSAEAGQVESPEPTIALHKVLHEIHTVMAMDDTVPFAELPRRIGHLIEERDMLLDEARKIAIALCVGEDDNLPMTACRITEQANEAKERAELLAKEVSELNRLLAVTPMEVPRSAEEVIVAKWSALPVPSGYETLTSVLEEAINQAANGEGLERHADGRPFHDQPIMREALAVGLGFPAGQARKKILEAVRCCDNHPERAVADLLGAINYTVALVIAIRSLMSEQAA